MSADLSSAVTRDRVAAAYALLRGAGDEVICDMRLSTLADIARGAPEHEPTRYSDAEVRLSWAVLSLAAEVVRRRSIGDELADVALGLLGYIDGLGEADEDGPDADVLDIVERWRAVR